MWASWNQNRRSQESAGPARSLEADQNDVMKRFTVVASLLLVPTFIVGMYGQNFDHIPELHWAQGYGFSMALILITTVAQLWYYRRKDYS